MVSFEPGAIGEAETELGACSQGSFRFDYCMRRMPPSEESQGDFELAWRNK